MLATLVTLSGCGGSPPQAAASSPSSSPSATPDPHVDANSVKQIELAANELKPLVDLLDTNGRPYHPTAATWTMINDGPIDISPSTHPGCLKQVPKYTAGYDREFSYGLDASGLERGHGDITVLASDSAQDVVVAQQEIATADYLSCYESQQVRAYLSAHDGVTVTGATSHRLESIDVGVPNVTVLFMTHYQFQNQTKVDYTVATWTAFDRYRVLIWVQTCCGEPTMADVQPNVLLVSQRMQAAAQGHL
jgi:hypothetical protein